MLLSNISRIVKDISHLGLCKVKYKSINNKLVLNLDLPVLKYGETPSVRGSGSLSLTVVELLGPLGSGVLRWEAERAWSNCSCSRRSCSWATASCWASVGWFADMFSIDSIIWVPEEEVYTSYSASRG